MRARLVAATLCVMSACGEARVIGGTGPEEESGEPGSSTGETGPGSEGGSGTSEAASDETEAGTSEASGGETDCASLDVEACSDVASCTVVWGTRYEPGSGGYCLADASEPLGCMPAASCEPADTTACAGEVAWKLEVSCIPPDFVLCDPPSPADHCGEVCDPGPPCDDPTDCPDGYYCIAGCCVWFVD